MLKLIFSFVCLACFLSLMSSPTEAEKKYSEDFFKSLNNVSGKKLKMDNINGGISIDGWDKDQIEINATKEVSSEKYEIPQEIKDGLKEIEIDIQENEGSIEITTNCPQGLEQGGKYQIRVYYKIYLPKKTDLKVETINGGIAIQGVAGTIQVKSINGGISLTALDGKIDIFTSNGGLSFRDIFGECDIQTMNGGIYGEYTILDKPLNLEVKSMNGQVSINLPQSEDIKAFAKCTNGSVSSKISLVKSKSELKGEKKIAIEVSNGSIKINKKQ